MSRVARHPLFMRTEMKKLLLTSDGLTSPALGKRFLELVGKDSEDIKVLFVPTASERKHDEAYLKRKTAYFDQCEEILVGFGVKKEHMVWLDINNILAAGDINSYDAMFVCGGNTFYLLHEIRRTGFDKKIIEFIGQGKLYIGESAGSILVGPSILIATPFDENDIGLTDNIGLKMTEKIICPHYNKKEKDLIDAFEKEHNCEVVRLKDGQAVEVLDGVSKINK